MKEAFWASLLERAAEVIAENPSGAALVARQLAGAIREQLGRDEAKDDARAEENRRRGSPVGGGEAW